ncbi:SigB/SigF/SigG family RNA polymerase sigma factor [Streptomyces sp. NPDC050145]|uniref:SigB/SigF/SigG family RNA polymerase sigma factor n=1 Tax=Streptomyces sp. NPDC050145 TaxID=3365602 RepID=UPI0037A98C67
MLTDSYDGVRRHGRSRRHHDDAPETARLFDRLAQAEPGPERDLLCEQAVQAWLPMAHRIARRFRDKGESLEDLQQIAALGLLKAVNRYDPQVGAFESYAVPTITGELRRHFRDHMWDVHVPRRIQDLRNTVRVTLRALMQQPGGRQPSVAEIADQAGLSEDEVREGLSALDSFHACSLDAEMSHSDQRGHTLAEVLGEPEPAYDLVEDREAAKDGLKHLPERERTILYLRFYRDMTQVKIGRELGISQMHVSRLLRQSCARVRQEAGEAAA